MAHLDTLKGRPICWCMNASCPVANTDIPYCWLDTMSPPGSCKFCNDPFLYDPSDCTWKPRKGKGKGKGVDYGGKGKGKGKAKGKQYTNQGYDQQNLQNTLYAKFMATIEKSGADAETLAQIKSCIETANQTKHQGPIPSAHVLSPHALLKREVKEAYSEIQQYKNVINQAKEKYTKLMDQLNTQMETIANLNNEHNEKISAFEILEEKLQNSVETKESGISERFAESRAIHQVLLQAKADADENEAALIPDDKDAVDADDQYQTSGDLIAEEESAAAAAADADMSSVPTKRSMLGNFTAMKESDELVQSRKSPRLSEGNG